uniref:Elongation of very long chain fatty acids protein n=1 Tax=Meloidogyne enterolobii TaxID=390850 RepID=A0A6V7X584_MELEN|nr:unnamed protein product [Meloidogyne enterolobii]
MYFKTTHKYFFKILYTIKLKYKFCSLINISKEQLQTYTQITELQTNQISGFWIFIWVLSKIPELFDTLFLILKGRPIRFMHWFHHSMSILFGTINFIGDNAYLVWVVWMNFFIHSIMYSYYMLTCFSFRFPKLYLNY